MTNKDKTKDLSMQCAYYFINQMFETNADTFSMDIKGVNRFGKKLGDYKLTVEKVNHD